MPHPYDPEIDPKFREAMRRSLKQRRPNLLCWILQPKVQQSKNVYPFEATCRWCQQKSRGVSPKQAIQNLEDAHMRARTEVKR